MLIEYVCGGTLNRLRTMCEPVKGVSFHHSLSENCPSSCYLQWWEASVKPVPVVLLLPSQLLFSFFNGAMLIVSTQWHF